MRARVQCAYDSIKRNVYKMDNYEDGIIVKPFRIHESDTVKKNTKNPSHQGLKHESNHVYNNSRKNSTLARGIGGHVMSVSVTIIRKNTYNNCLHPDYRQPQMTPSQHHNQPQQFSRHEYRHSSITPSHSTNYRYSPPMSMHTQQTGYNNYHRPEVTNVLPYLVTE